MIKFFRKIRQKLLSENKLNKYLIYAIGEIILVVIGILIALSVNNYNERKKSEDKVTAIFEELLDELATNISSVKDAGLFYESKDSLSFLVLNTNISKEDYKKNRIDYSLLIRSNHIINLSNNAYSKLINMTDAIPKEQNNLLKQLYWLNQKKTYLDFLDNRLSDNVNDIIKHQTYNYSWAIKFNEEEFIEYLLNDPRYKSDVQFLSFSGRNEHFEHAYYYMQRAIRCYKHIAQLLNKPIDYSLLGFNPEVSKTLIGDWSSEQFPGLIVSIYVDNNRLLIKNNQTTDIFEFHFLSETKLIDTFNENFLTIVKNKGNIMLKRNNGVIWKKVKD